MNQFPVRVLCVACAELGLTTQATAPHDALVEQGVKPSQSPNGIERQYRCSHCNTVWLEYTDKWGIAGAFRLAPNGKR